MQITGTLPDTEPSRAQPLRDSARALHHQFVAEMLKQARLGEALGAGGEGGLAPALAHEALSAIAAQVVDAQPALTERLYRALSRPEESNLDARPFTQM